MDHEALRGMTLEQLNAARQYLLSPEGQAGIDRLPPEEALAAADKLDAIQQAINALRNAQLQQIVAGLAANGAALEAGTKALRSGLEGIRRVEQVLRMASAVVELVGAVVKA